MSRLPQGLKPTYSAVFTARLKSCPSQKPACIGVVQRFVASLKRCPNTRRNRSRNLRTLLVRIFPVRLFPILLTAALSAQQPPPTATIGPAPVQIAPPRPNYSFPDGRGYVYLAEWHLITAGTAA